MEHHFNTDIAKDYGIEEAILIHHFYFWIAKNAANKKNFHDGLYWTYNSRDAYAKFFGYINETKIYRIIKKFVTDGILVKGNYNTDKWKHTNWYALTVKGLGYLNNNGYAMTPFEDVLQNANTDCVKMNNGLLHNEQSIINYTDNNNTDNNKEEGINIPPKKIDYQAIVDCWNEHNGKKLGKVTKITERRKKAIKKALDDNGITQEQLMLFFKTLPHADKWLYNPNKQHANWKPDFDWWLSNPNGWLTKGLEGKVHLENPQVYSSIMLGKDATYTPQGRTIWFNEQTKSYWSDDNFYYESISDGYEDDNRPDGATLTLNNARGNIKWNAQTKKWEKV